MRGTFNQLFIFKNHANQIQDTTGVPGKKDWEKGGDWARKWKTEGGTGAGLFSESPPYITATDLKATSQSFRLRSSQGVCISQAITMCLDNKAALFAPSSHKIGSKLVYRRKNALVVVAEKTVVRLVWDKEGFLGTKRPTSSRGQR